jgi:hypothetical protein
MNASDMERQCSCGFDLCSLPFTCTRAPLSKLLRHGQGCEGYDTNHDTNSTLCLEGRIEGVGEGFSVPISRLLDTRTLFRVLKFFKFLKLSLEDPVAATVWFPS